MNLFSDRYKKQSLGNLSTLSEMWLLTSDLILICHNLLYSDFSFFAFLWPSTSLMRTHPLPSQHEDTWTWLSEWLTSQRETLGPSVMGNSFCLWFQSFPNWQYHYMHRWNLFLQWHMPTAWSCSLLPRPTPTNALQFVFWRWMLTYWRISWLLLESSYY